MEAQENGQGGPNASTSGTNDSAEVSIEDDAFLYLSNNEIELLGEWGPN